VLGLSRECRRRRLRDQPVGVARMRLIIHPDVDMVGGKEALKDSIVSISGCSTGTAQQHAMRRGVGINEQRLNQPDPCFRYIVTNLRKIVERLK
jgi:hypothetical protein